MRKTILLTLVALLCYNADANAWGWFSKSGKARVNDTKSTVENRMNDNTREKNDDTKARKATDLTITMSIDNTYAFGFDLRESRSAKGGIWNLKTGNPETPLNYSQAKADTINGQPVVKLYREVGLGNHPLNGWETWILKDKKWIEYKEDTEPTPDAKIDNQ